MHNDDEQYLGTGWGGGYDEEQTLDTYSTYPRGVHMRITFGGTIGDIEPMFLINQVIPTSQYMTSHHMASHRGLIFCMRGVETTR